MIKRLKLIIILKPPESPLSCRRRQLGRIWSDPTGSYTCLWSTTRAEIHRRLVLRWSCSVQQELLLVGQEEEQTRSKYTICNHQQCVPKHNKMAWNIPLLEMLMMGFFTSSSTTTANQTSYTLIYVSGMVVLLIKFLFDLTRRSRDHHYDLYTLIFSVQEVLDDGGKLPSCAYFWDASKCLWSVPPFPALWPSVARSGADCGLHVKWWHATERYTTSHRTSPS